MRVESLQHRRVSLSRQSTSELSVPSMRVESLQHHANPADLAVNFVFQYPPCGSSRCNHNMLPGVRYSSRLSVPSMRVESLQHHHRCSPRSQSTSFSTLHAGRVAATAVPPIHDRPPLFFQYPPCGSSRCNARHRPGATGMTTLSVPSMRVESLQPISRDEDRPSRVLFHY